MPSDRLKPMDVLKQGFYRIKNLDTGGLTSTPLTYGPGKSRVLMRCVLTSCRRGR